FIQRVAIRKCLPIDGSSNVVKARVERIEQNQPLLCEHPREKLPERAAVGLFRAIALLEIAGHLGTSRTSKQVARALGDFLDGGPQLHASDRSTGKALRGKLESRQLTDLEQRNMAHLVQVVVFGSHPEDRHSRDAFGG